MVLTNKRIGVLMGGSSAEREISLRGGQQVARSLLRMGYNAVEIDVDSSLVRTLEKEKIEIAFILLHGRGGEDGTIQGLLDILGIPYTGSGALASALAMDKIMTKRILGFYRIPTPAYSIFTRNGRGEEVAQYPCVIKPSAEGSTIGVSIVKEKGALVSALKTAFSFGPRVLVEEYIEGQELTVGILEEVPLPVIEVRAPGGFYDYQAKYTGGMTQYLCPAPLPSDLSRKAQQVAMEVHQILGCTGFSRVDMRMDKKGDVYVLEINTIPGMTQTSLLPMGAQAVGIGYDLLVEKMLESALHVTRR